MTTLLPSFSDGSSTLLRVTWTAIKAWKSLNFGRIPSPTTVLAALSV